MKTLAEDNAEEIKLLQLQMKNKDEEIRRINNILENHWSKIKDI